MSRILITVPTWNEALVIGANLSSLIKQAQIFLAEHDVLIELADNGSTDETAAIAERLGVSVLRLRERGKGLAVKQSWSNHLGDRDVLIFMDADLAADLAALPLLVRPILLDEADLVCGSRFIQGAHVERIWLREAASWLYRGLQKMILNLPVKDAQCGFKAISAAAATVLLPSIKEKTWLFDTELLALAKRRKYAVREVPVSWVEHRDPERRSAIKIGSDGWGFIKGLFRIKSRLSK